MSRIKGTCHVVGCQRRQTSIAKRKGSTYYSRWCSQHRKAYDRVGLAIEAAL